MCLIEHAIERCLATVIVVGVILWLLYSVPFLLTNVCVCVFYGAGCSLITCYLVGETSYHVESISLEIRMND